MLNKLKQVLSLSGKQAQPTRKIALPGQVVLSSFPTEKE
jgi:hypothetical protein